ncbi:glycosyltransferase [Mangrovibacterium lignilyticum]|uniref:glycosyltransferase n=1 Tax=Mangrovibacterium lignilyticum TaxID=2668052 RepID=UPI0013D862A0|nr:glycosyltransferase [Mangrovibacterium lignilyticum]
MSFANRYIDRNITCEPFIERPPHPDLEMIVVIPVCDEAELINTIDSLAACKPPKGSVEVLLVVNESETASTEIHAQNELTVKELEQWRTDHPDCLFDLHVLRPEPFPRKHAGAGIARKTGMDEAIRRFATCDKADGIVVSLDADTLVNKNYFLEIQQAFQASDKTVGATIRFQHRLDELTNERHRQGMQLYETYLHYYKQALAFTGYPNAIYTIGSAFAVRADAYVKQGGMSKRKAGEDFYFLHKLTAMGPIAEINSTCVYPSARLSNRVPFGTGPSLQKWVDGDESLSETYAFMAFVDLMQFFKLVPDLFQSGWEGVQVPAAVQSFLQDDRFSEALADIQRNSASLPAFKKRFFQYFNAFKILKFLNFSHPRFYAFQDLNEAYSELKG